MEFFVPAGDDGCKNKPEGEDDSVGEKNLLERLLCGEILCGKRYFAEVLMRAPLGIPLIGYVGEFDELRWGVGRTSPRMIFPWQLAEGNPIISSGGE